MFEEATVMLKKNWCSKVFIDSDDVHMSFSDAGVYFADIGKYWMSTRTNMSNFPWTRIVPYTLHISGNGKHLNTILNPITTTVPSRD